MEFINFISELFFFILSAGESKRENKSLLRKILFNLFLLTGLLWIVIELQTIQHLDNPYLFVGLTIIISLAFSILLIAGFFKMKLFCSIKPSEFFLWVLVLTLNFTAMVSCYNRITDFYLMNTKKLEVK